MKSIFRKELRQGRSLLVSGVALAALPYLAHLLFATQGAGDPALQGGEVPVDRVLGLVVVVSPLLFALFAGVGLFASEAEHGTLPVLLGLPLSRKRLWLAKGLSGLVLTVIPSAVVLLTGKLLMPSAFAFVGLTPWIDVAMLGLFVLSAGLFVTVLTPHTIGAAVATVALVVGLAIGGFVFTNVCGAPLLGYSELLDVELWLVLITPTMLFLSVQALRRGELLEWRRSTLVLLPLLAVGIALTVGVVGGAGRLLTGYDRGSVREVATQPTVPSATAVAVLSYSRPVPYERGARDNARPGAEAQGTSIGWKRRPTVGPASLGNHDSGTLYRNHSAVVVDLSRGKELAVVRDSQSHHEPVAAVSPDGRYAALATAPPGLTWGGRALQGATRRLTIVDLKEGRYREAELPAQLLQEETVGVARLAWSPSGNYLAFNRTVGGSEDASADLFVMAREGGAAKLLEARASGGWAWHPREEALLVADGERLRHLSPDGASAVLWQSPQGDDGALSLDPAGISRETRRVVLSVFSSGAAGGWDAMERTPRRPGECALLALPLEGGEAQTLWQSAGGWHFSFAWRGDTLFVLATAAETSPKHPVTRARLLRWRPGEPKAVELAEGLPYPNGALAPVREGVLLWPQRPYRKEQYQLADTPLPFTVGVMAVAEDGRLRRLPGELSSLRFVEENRLVTVAADGELITAQGAPVARALVATDVRTGASRRLYP